MIPPTVFLDPEKKLINHGLKNKFYQPQNCGVDFGDESKITADLLPFGP